MKRILRYFKTNVILFILLLASVVWGASAKGIPFHRVSGGINTDAFINDTFIRTSPIPYGDAIQHGYIANHFGGHKFGSNGNVGTTEELIWPLSNGRIYLTAAETLQVKSSDVDDTAAGTGARTVLLTGQTTGFVEITETVILNGTTSVETTNSFLRIYRVKVITAGSSEINEGNISINDNADINTLAYISANRGQSQMCFWTVPANREMYVHSIHAGEIANKRVTVRLYARDNTVTDASWQLKAELEVNLSDITREFLIPIKFTEKTDVRLVGEATTTGGVVTAGFVFYYED